MNYTIIIIIIIILILFIIKEKYYNNIDNFSDTNNKYVCMYAYYEKNEEYKENLIYFLQNGLLEYVDYYIIINGECTVDIPNLNNIKVLKRENKGFDFGAWSYCIKQLTKEYDYYVFLNTSVRGPYLSEEDINNNVSWLDKFLVLFNNKDIKMVGTTIIIFYLKYFNSFYNLIYNYKEIYYKDNNIDIYDEYLTHIQSMFFILNNEGLNYLLSQNFFDEDRINNYNDILDIIINYEIRLTQLILKNNWNIGSILDIYKNIDFRTNTDFINNEIPLKNEEIIFYKNWNK